MSCVVTDIISEIFLKTNFNLGLLVFKSILKKSAAFLPGIWVALYSIS